MSKRNAPTNSDDSGRRRKRAKLTTTALNTDDGNSNSQERFGDDEQDLVIDISHVFEYVPRREVREVFYAVRCGPVIVRRRRRDAEIEIVQVLKLARVLHGDDLAHTSLRDLADRAEDDEVNLVLTHSNSRQTVSADELKRTIEGTGLADCLSTLLDGRLPNLANDRPITLHPKAGVVDTSQICRYCSSAFDSTEIGRHHQQHRGLCQLDDSAGARAFTTVFQKHLHETVQGDQNPPINQLDAVRQIDSRGWPQYLGASVWTAADMDALYNGLRRYSKWQIDAIAASIPSKSLSDVVAAVNALDEAAHLFPKGKAQTTLRGIPCARESSQKLVDAEDALAQDLVIWEALAQQAGRTPRTRHDRVEKACTAAPGLTVACSTCRLSTFCDGAWPVCNRCSLDGVACVWPADFHPSSREAMFAPRRIDLRTMLPSMPNDTKTLRRREIRSEAMSSIAWAQLVALGDNRLLEQHDLRWIWLEAKHQEADPLRNLIQTTLSQNGLDGIPAQRKEAVYAAVIHHAQASGDSESTLSAENILEHAKGHAGIVEARKIPQRYKESRMRAWTEIPLSITAAADKESAGLDTLFAAELEQGHKQVKALGLYRDDFGKAGVLFDLRSVGIKLRAGVDVDQSDVGAACATLQDLYAKLLAYLRSVIATSVCIAEMGDENVITKATLLKAIEMMPSAEWTIRSPQAEVEQPLLQSRTSTFQPDALILPRRDAITRRCVSPHIVQATDGRESDQEDSGDESDLLADMMDEDDRIDQQDRLDDLAEEALFWQQLGETSAAQTDGEGLAEDPTRVADEGESSSESSGPSDNDTTDAREPEMESAETMLQEPPKTLSKAAPNTTKSSARFRTKEFISSSDDDSDL